MTGIFRIILMLLVLSAQAVTAAPPVEVDPGMVEKNDQLCWDSWTSGSKKMLLLCKSTANQGGAKSLFVWGMHLAEQAKYIKSMEYLKDSIKAGFNEAYGVVGDYYYFGGGGLALDHCKALEVYRQGEEKGNPTAAKGYAKSLLTGACTGEVELDKGREVIKQHKLVLDGELQDSLATGYFTRKDKIRGAAWLLLAKESGMRNPVDVEAYIANNFSDAEIEKVLVKKAEIEKVYGNRLKMVPRVYWYEKS